MTKHAVLFMVADHRWKLIHAEGYRPMLYDLEDDPNEFEDLGENPAYDEVRAMMYERLFQWSRGHAQRTTRSEAEIKAMRGGSRRKGVLLGLYDGSEVPAELTANIGARSGEGAFGLIVETLDGFVDLKNVFTPRGQCVSARRPEQRSQT